MGKEYITDFYGKILGSLETMPNGDIIVRNFPGQILGKYEKSSNYTKDFYGKILYKGNMAPALLVLFK